jgi:hypothetical protein
MGTEKTDKSRPDPIKVDPAIKPFFWDYDCRRLRWERDQDFIISRILSFGDWQALLWLRSVMQDKDLAQRILASQGHGLSPQRLRFWELILGLPHRKVNEWLKIQKRGVWGQRTNL